ncbi:hypothetical protein [Streptacidiphilus cavernicola]|uniref:Beta-ketoacyl synthase N-terminal domain-containing protein n=1 Tax=Streptacidiphilus cavernicola TaxID=3342716 RepID=A0ABV6W0Y4_9ACTN
MVLQILAEGRWPTPDDSNDPNDSEGLEPPPLPGFTSSSFNPLVAVAAERCLRAGFGDRAVPDRTALLLTSRSGDRATARAIDTAAQADRRMPPLLFFQSNPNAVLGHIAARHRLTGPVVAVSPGPAVSDNPGEVPSDAMALAELLLADGDADLVLVIAAEQADPADPAVLTVPAGHPAQHDRAVAVLVRSA